MASDEDSRNMAIKVVAGLFMSIAAVAVALRCYVRGFLVKAFGWDDGAMVMAMVNSAQLPMIISHTNFGIRPGMQCFAGL